MESDNIFQLIFLIILLCLSAFFSSAETALTTCNKLRVKTLADGGNKTAAILYRIIDNPSGMLSTVLVGNNLVNISASALSTVFVQSIFGSYAISIGTGILTLIILIFGELTPKTFATIHADGIALKYARAIRAIMWILAPVIFITNKISFLLIKLLRIDTGKKSATFTEHELRTIVDVSHEEGVIEKEEKEIINNIFDFGDTQAKDIMIPRIDMCMVDENISYEELIEIFKRDRYTRLPVCSGDDVTGIINIKDLLFYSPGDEFKLSDYLRPAFFTYEYKNLTELMYEMRKCSVNIIIVLDEYGVTAGLITLEDILEEIVGEIKDEYDYDEEETVKNINDNEYLADGRISLDDLNDKLNLNLDSDTYDSLGGFIIEHLDRLAVENDRLVYDNIVFIVQKMDKNRIDKVLITIKDPSGIS